MLGFCGIRSDPIECRWSLSLRVDVASLPRGLYAGQLGYMYARVRVLRAASGTWYW